MKIFMLKNFHINTNLWNHFCIICYWSRKRISMPLNLVLSAKIPRHSQLWYMISTIAKPLSLRSRIFYFLKIIFLHISRRHGELRVSGLWISRCFWWCLKICCWKWKEFYMQKRLEFCIKQFLCKNKLTILFWLFFQNHLQKYL